MQGVVHPLGTSHLQPQLIIQTLKLRRLQIESTDLESLHSFSDVALTMMLSFWTRTQALFLLSTTYLLPQVSAECFLANGDLAIYDNTLIGESCMYVMKKMQSVELERLSRLELATPERLAYSTCFLSTCFVDTILRTDNN